MVATLRKWKTGELAKSLVSCFSPSPRVHLSSNMPKSSWWAKLRGPVLEAEKRSRQTSPSFLGPTSSQGPKATQVATPGTKELGQRDPQSLEPWQIPTSPDLGPWLQKKLFIGLSPHQPFTSSWISNYNLIFISRLHGCSCWTLWSMNQSPAIKGMTSILWSITTWPKYI